MSEAKRNEKWFKNMLEPRPRTGRPFDDIDDLVAHVHDTGNLDFTINGVKWFINELIINGFHDQYYFQRCNASDDEIFDAKCYHTIVEAVTDKCFDGKSLVELLETADFSGN